jgi:hypothetical protein
LDTFREWLVVAASAVLGGAATFLLFLRKVMTKAEHIQVCVAREELVEQKIETVKAELGGDVKALREVQANQGRLLERMDKKLDSIINGGRR